MVLFSESTVVSNEVFDCPVLGLVVTYASGVRLFRVDSVDAGTGEGAPLVVAVVEASADLVRETLDPRSPYLCIATVVSTESE